MGMALAVAIAMILEQTGRSNGMSGILGGHAGRKRDGTAQKA
jgi:hypothetical protein